MSIYSLPPTAMNKIIGHTRPPEFGSTGYSRNTFDILNCNLGGAREFKLGVMVAGSRYCLTGFHWAIGLKSTVFTNGPADQDSIPGWVIPKTQKMVLDAALLSTQHYKVRIKEKVKQSCKWSSTLPFTSV